MSLTRATIVFRSGGETGREGNVGGAVTLLPKRAPVGNSSLIRGRTLAVFATPTPPPGLAGWYVATVEPGGRAGFAAADLAEDEALALARALGLEEILFWDGRRARLLAVTS